MAAPVIRRAGRPTASKPVVEEVEEPVVMRRGWLGDLRAQVAGAFRDAGARVWREHHLVAVREGESGT